MSDNLKLLTPQERAAIAARANKVLPGHNVTPIGGGVAIGCIDPNAHDLLERAMDERAKHKAEAAEKGIEIGESEYSFAYWLFRWSGLVDPYAKEDRSCLLRHVEALERELRWYRDATYADFDPATGEITMGEADIDRGQRAKEVLK